LLQRGVNLDQINRTGLNQQTCRNNHMREFLPQQGRPLEKRESRPQQNSVFFRMIKYRLRFLMLLPRTKHAKTLLCKLVMVTIGSMYKWDSTLVSTTKGALWPIRQYRTTSSFFVVVKTCSHNHL
jgi:hypothetical protein